MNKTVYRVFAALVFVCAVASSEVQASTVVDRIAAVVGDEIILQSEVEEQVVLTKMQVPETRDDSELRRRILDNLVMQKIVLTKARLDSVSVNEQEIDQETDERLMFLRGRFKSIDDMEQRFSKSYAVIEKEIREDIRNQQLVDNLRRQKMSGVTVRYDEVEDFYDRNREDMPVIPESVQVSQIIMYPRVTAESRQEARKRIEDALFQLREGVDFATVAREYSQDPGSAAVGGDLGISRRGEFVKPFEDAAFSLEEGEISDIIETRYGYHILEVIERRNDTVHARHILAMFDRSNLDRQAAREKLEEIREDVLSGNATFAAMASRYSDDPLSSSSGGVIRQQGSGAVDALFPVESLKDPLKGIVARLDGEGDVSNPVLIEVESGEPFYAIFRIDRRIPRHKMSLSTDYARLEQLAVDEKQKRLFTEWIDRLKDEVYVRIYGSDI